MDEELLDQSLIEDFVYMLTEEELEDFMFKYNGSFRRFRFTTYEQALEVYPEKPIILHAHFNKVTGDLIGYMESPNPRMTNNHE